MANPLAPGVSVKGKHVTSRTIPGNTNFRTGVQIPPSRPKSKQGNVTSGSTFNAMANNESMGGNSDSYRVPANPRFNRLTGKHSGFGAVKRPVKGKGPMGNQSGIKANFGRV